MNAIDLVIKIGSMALIQRDDGAIDYNIFQRLGDDLRPGMALVTSGATEIGRIDYIRRTGGELHGDLEQDKADYAAQGQIIPQTLKNVVVDGAFLALHQRHAADFDDQFKRFQGRSFLSGR